MKRLLMLTLFLVVASVPAYASIDCYTYVDTIPYSDPDMNFCYWYGGICYQCVDVQRGTGWADSRLCDPDAIHIPVPRYLLVQLSPAKNTGRAQVAAARQGHPSRSGRSNSIRPVSARVARLNAGNLL